MHPKVKSVPKMILKFSIQECWRETFAEGIGTFILVFAGTGAVMVNQLRDGEH
jgi:glycerol uptake facilitator-like aquaporin